MVTADYTVRLDQVFQGPMDLLLHLVREQEVEIYEIEINSVVDGYLAYMNELTELDIEVAADFIVMAATLMAIKSRSLLPREEVDLEAELDPRDELIQRLIEYRHFKDAAGDLGDRLTETARRFPHGVHAPTAEEPTLDVSELSQWDLLSAFSRLMRETMSHRAMEITADERPLRHYVERLVGWVKRNGEFSLRSWVKANAEAEETGRQMMIGTFCALLELMKLGVVSAYQGDPTGDITIAVRDEARDDIDDIVRLSGFDDETSEQDQASKALDAPQEGPMETAPEANGERAHSTEDPEQHPGDGPPPDTSGAPSGDAASSPEAS